MAKLVTSDNFEQEVLESNLPVLIDVFAPWCGPCNIIAPIIEEIAEEYQGKVKVGKLNVDEAPEVSSQYNVMSIPTLMIFKNGKTVEEMVGIAPKEYIEEKIDKHIK